MKALKIAQKFMKQAYGFSCVMLQIPEPEAQEIRDWGLKNIPDRLLTGDGREDAIHVTIKYGIHISDFTEARNLFIKEKSIKIVLRNISLFNSDDADVVKIDVDSPDLVRLNKVIADNFEVTDTHPIYLPHITVAYVLKSFGEPYNGRKDFAGKKVTSDSIIFSGKDNRETLFKLSH